MTVQEFQARKIERTAALLAYVLAETREERRDWRPSSGADSCATSALEQIAECIWVNRRAAAVLSGRESPPKPASFRVSSAEAESELLASSRDLAAVVRALPEEDLEREYPGPRGPVTGEFLIDQPNRNMFYHIGQINYIQLLYGDTENHFPPPPKP